MITHSQGKKEQDQRKLRSSLGNWEFIIILSYLHLEIHPECNLGFERCSGGLGIEDAEG